MQRFSWYLLLSLLLAFPAAVSVLTANAQQRNRDPLTDKETDEIRDAADFPDKRIELLAGFARARIAAIDQLRANGKAAPNRPQQIHDLLEDFLSLVDEIDDNVDMYQSHKTDMRKGLKVLIEADSEWALSLRTLETQSPPEELNQYSFALSNAKDSVKDSADNARQTLQEQIELAKNKQLNKDYSERPN